MRYIDPNQPDSKVQFKAQYENFIGGQWVAPVRGEYFDNLSPVDGKVFTKIPRSSVEDIELALDAAHKAKAEWNKSSPTVRSNILLKIAESEKVISTQILQPTLVVVFGSMLLIGYAIFVLYRYCNLFS